MLTISPTEDAKILKICDSAKATVLLCKDDSVDKGYIAFEQNGYVLDIVGFDVYGADLALAGDYHIIADSLLRALGSYALNHSCFYIQCSKLELYWILKKFSFAENDNYLTINLQQLFKVCKN